MSRLGVERGRSLDLLWFVEVGVLMGGEEGF